MADPNGFMKFARVAVPHRSIDERTTDWNEVDRPMPPEVMNEQAARCMDCGIPFCHGIGCPLQNRIPEFNELVYQGHWRKAVENLHATNNFPEITGRICPAPCETACTLALNDAAVNIKHIEYQIAEWAFADRMVVPLRPKTKTGKRVAIVGSGPAGLATAQQLARIGHEVVLFEKDDRIGGLLRYGIPDFKLSKRLIDVRLEQMAAEGVKFEPSVVVGKDISGRYLQRTFDAIVLAMGAGKPRMLDVPGAELDGVHLALDYLGQQNRRVAGDLITNDAILATDKHVVVVGGGDTGSDCVGTAIRQGAQSVTQLEILPKPPEQRNPKTPWPSWPLILRTSTSQEEGCQRQWGVQTQQLVGANGQVAKLHGCEVQWIEANGGWKMESCAGTEFTLAADLVLLAMGFVHVEHTGLLETLDVAIDGRGNVVVDDWMTSCQGIFAAGDTVRGASLVVHAINQGRLVAAAVDRWLLKA